MREREPVTATATGVRLSVHVQPRASQSEVVGRHGEAIKLRIAAPPVDGAANAAVIELLSERLGVPRRTIRITAGTSDRRKTVEIDGITPETVRQRLGFVFGTGPA